MFGVVYNYCIFCYVIIRLFRFVLFCKNIGGVLYGKVRFENGFRGIFRGGSSSYIVLCGIFVSCGGY